MTYNELFNLDKKDALKYLYDLFEAYDVEKKRNLEKTEFRLDSINFDYEDSIDIIFTRNDKDKYLLELMQIYSYVKPKSCACLSEIDEEDDITTGLETFDLDSSRDIKDILDMTIFKNDKWDSYKDIVRKMKADTDFSWAGD